MVRFPLSELIVGVLGLVAIDDDSTLSTKPNTVRDGLSLCGDLRGLIAGPQFGSRMNMRGVAGGQGFGLL